MVDKKVLRKTYLEKRIFLSESEYEKRNALLAVQFQKELDLQNISTLHTFLSIPSKKEADTFRLIRLVRDGAPHVTIYSSRTLKNSQLEHFCLLQDTPLITNSWGIPEPAECEASRPDQLDIILVPLISFDKKGHRIGYGKGYYDRFLNQFPEALKVGLSLGPPIDTIAFINSYDIPLSMCLTPYKTYRFA